MKKINVHSLLKLTMPKVAQISFNFFRLGPRTIFRQSIQLLRANFWTRLISVLVVIVFDLIKFFQKKITHKELVQNLIQSIFLIIGATFGWIGATRIALKFWVQFSIWYLLFGLVGALLLGSLFEIFWKKMSLYKKMEK